MLYDVEMRAKVGREAVGKVVESLEWVDDAGGYWVMTFADESEMSFRLIAEMLIGAAPARDSPESGGLISEADVIS